jgi:hypothetical protein
MPRAVRAAFVFWGGPAFALGRRPRAEAGAPLVWEDLSGDLPGGLVSPAIGAEAEAAREVLVADGVTATIRALGLRAGVLVLAPRASAGARARSQQRRPTVAVVGMGGGEPPVGLPLLRRPSPSEWGCSHLRRGNQSSVRNGTSNASVFCSLWLSEPEHVCNFGTEPCFFLIFEH